jgi:hypothetical protein
VGDLLDFPNKNLEDGMDEASEEDLDQSTDNDENGMFEIM